MGKRELLLIILFALGGTVVYQVTAPPPAPGDRGLSVGRMIDMLRRHLRGNSASAETTTTTRHAVAATVSEFRIASPTGQITVVGEVRDDIEAELRVRSNGLDVAEAERLAHETAFVAEESGSRLDAHISYPELGTQRLLQLTLKVPARLQVVFDAAGGPLTVTGVAGVELSSTRGEARVQHIAGNVTGSHRGGELRIFDSPVVRMSATGADVQLERIAKETTLTVRSGEVKGTDLGGAVSVDSRGAAITLDQLQHATGVLHVKADSGSITIKGLVSDARLEVRNADVEVAADRPSAVSIQSEGRGSIDVTPANGGYQLDAVAEAAEISLPEGTLEPTSSGQERRASGPVHGGGPPLTIRTARADITLRQR